MNSRSISVVFKESNSIYYKVMFDKNSRSPSALECQTLIQVPFKEFKESARTLIRAMIRVRFRIRVIYMKRQPFNWPPQVAFTVYSVVCVHIFM